MRRPRGIIRTLNGPESGAWLDDEERPLSEALPSHARLPQAIIGDRGFAYPSIYAMNTGLGIQTVTPWRNFGDGRAEVAEILVGGQDGLPCVVDRHGVIHCRHSGGPTKRVELRLRQDQNPRIYVRCLLPSAPNSACQQLQSVSCAFDWRMLTELPGDDPRYLALASLFQLERSHHLRRARNRNGVNDPLLRPKRLGRAWQQLLLSLGTMLDWFRAGLKHGWLESEGRRFKGYEPRC